MQINFIIITGAAGFIGNQLVRKIEQEQPLAIIAAIDLPGSSWGGDNGANTYRYEVDLADISKWNWVELMQTGLLPLVAIEAGDLTPDSEFNPIDRGNLDNQVSTTIYHLASIVGVSTVTENPETLLQELKINSSLTESLNITDNDINLAFTSTSEIYGQRTILEEKSEMLFQSPEGYPRGIYATQKLTAEHLFLNCITNQTSTINIRVLRLFSITGETQSLDFVLPKMVQQAVAGDDITVYGEGSQSRVFMHVDDLCNFMTLDTLFDSAFFNDQHINSRIINVANLWNYATMHQLAWIIKRTVASTSEVVYLEGDTGEESRTPQIERMLKFYKPEIKLEEIINRVAQELDPAIIRQPVIITDATWVESTDPETGDDMVAITLTGTVEPLAEIEALFPDTTLEFTTADASGDFVLVADRLKLEMQDGNIIVSAKLNESVFSQDSVTILQS